MSLHRIMKKGAIFFVSLCLMGLNLAPAQAAMVGTHEMIQQENSRLERAQLNEMLDRADVQNKLIELGVDPAMAKERAASLTDTEIAQLNAQIAELPAGEGVLGIVVLFVLVFIITDIIGATDIFPFVHPVK